MAANAIAVRVHQETVSPPYLSDRAIIAQLVEAEKEANDPNTQWLSHDEVFGKLREKHGYEV